MTLDKLYEDFTANIAPKIAEGLIITKEYFIDLFGRYIKYLIITDAIMLGINLIIFIGSIVCVAVFFPKSLRAAKENGNEVFLIFWMFAFLPILLPAIAAVSYSMDIVKAVYIPEVRIIEEIQQYRDAQ